MYLTKIVQEQPRPTPTQGIPLNEKKLVRCPRVADRKVESFCEAVGVQFVIIIKNNLCI